MIVTAVAIAIARGRGATALGNGSTKQYRAYLSKQHHHIQSKRRETLTKQGVRSDIEVKECLSKRKSANDEAKKYFRDTA